METNKKKSYKKPQLQEVKLIPEEAVLTACKATATTRSGTRPCNCANRFQGS